MYKVNDRVKITKTFEDSITGRTMLRQECTVIGVSNKNILLENAKYILSHEPDEIVTRTVFVEEGELVQNSELLLNKPKPDIKIGDQFRALEDIKDDWAPDSERRIIHTGETFTVSDIAEQEGKQFLILRRMGISWTTYTMSIDGRAERLALVKEEEQHQKQDDLAEKMRKLCNGQENKSSTPDYILAQYLLKCLEAYEETVVKRDEWLGRKPWKP